MWELSERDHIRIASIMVLGRWKRLTNFANCTIFCEVIHLAAKLTTPSIRIKPFGIIRTRASDVSFPRADETSGKGQWVVLVHPFPAFFHRMAVGATSKEDYLFSITLGQRSRGIHTGSISPQ